MRIRLATRLFAGFLLLLGLFAAVVAVNYRLAQQVFRNSLAVEASQQISAGGAQLLQAVVDMETGFRGYLLIGNEATLEPYYKGQQQLTGKFAELRQQVAAEPQQQLLLRQAEVVFRQWQAYSYLLINEKRTARHNNPNQTGLAGLAHGYLAENLTGKHLMDKIRQRLGAFARNESRTRATLRQQLQASIDRAQLLSGIMGSTAFVIGLVWAFYLVRMLTRRLHDLLQLARRISEGDYKVQIIDTAHDEVSALSLALNKMARTVDANISQLENRNSELDQFAYVVSHDLKAPLRAIESASRWIEEDMTQEGLPPHIREFLALMRQRVGRMENLIAGILELARVGRVAHADETVFVRQLLREIINSIAPPKGFAIELPFFLPTLTTNRIQLQQVFTNLLSNAIKYHHHPATGHVNINCEEEGAFYRFAVTDNGPGIDPEYHERIFVIFQTLVERDTRESTGVGLAIVKKIVERQGGRIGIQSAEGAGATFYFTWPKLPPVVRATGS